MKKKLCCNRLLNTVLPSSSSSIHTMKSNLKLFRLKYKPKPARDRQTNFELFLGTCALVSRHLSSSANFFLLSASPCTRQKPPLERDDHPLTKFERIWKPNILFINRECVVSNRYIHADSIKYHCGLRVFSCSEF